MRCRRTTDADLPRLKALWKEGFSDTDADIDRFFLRAYPHTLGFAAEVDGSLAAALYALPLTLTDGAVQTPCAYLYAVATARAHRGKGICRALMAYAEKSLSQQGFPCALLVPGEPSLFAFYERMGYRAQKCHTIAPLPALHFCGTVQAMDAAQYGALRERLLAKTPHVTYDDRWLRFTGASFYALELDGQTGCAAVLGNTVLELLPDAKMSGALAAIVPQPISRADDAHAEQAAAALSSEAPTLRAPGKTHAFAMAKPLTADVLSEPIYLAFAYE